MNTNYISPEAYQESITKELALIKNRVRNLIGDANWGEEGRYKEAILKNVIKKYLPTHLSVGTGFIINKPDDGELAGQFSITKQIDIIIFDNRVPVIFSEGDFIITSPSHVEAIIEVKSKVDNSKLREYLDVYVENLRIINKGLSLLVCFLMNTILIKMKKN